MADEKLTALTATTTPASTDIVYVVVDPGTTPVSKKATLASVAGGMDAATWAVIQASQLTNEIKGWRPVVNAGDLDALNLWWDKVGTPTTAPTIQDTSAAGLTDNYELCLKVVTDAASEGLSQTWTYADEPRVKSGRVMSAILAIWSVSSVSVTAKLVNSDASETAASAVTAAAWTIVKIENHTLAGTSCSLQVTAGAAGTFYAVPLGANIGAKAVPLAPRGLRYVEVAATNVVNGVDPGGADYTDADFTAATSPLACILNITVAYSASTLATLYVRRNGSTETKGVVAAQVVNVLAYNTLLMECDDGQILEYKTGVTAGATEAVYIQILGYWEWA